MLLPLQGSSSKLYLFFKGTNDLKKKKKKNPECDIGTKKLCLLNS